MPRRMLNRFLVASDRDSATQNLLTTMRLGELIGASLARPSQSKQWLPISPRQDRIQALDEHRFAKTRLGDR